MDAIDALIEYNQTRATVTLHNSKKVVVDFANAPNEDQKAVITKVVKLEGFNCDTYYSHTGHRLTSYHISCPKSYQTRDVAIAIAKSLSALGMNVECKKRIPFAGSFNLVF